MTLTTASEEAPHLAPFTTGLAPRDHSLHDELVHRCVNSELLATAVIYPVDSMALAATLESAEAGIISPILVGPAQVMRDVAKAAGLDISAWPIVDAPTDIAAANEGAELARTGRAQALMKGSLRSSTLLHPVVSARSGLRGPTRLSHVFVLDVPAYPKPLLVSDAVVSIAPTLENKAVICRNAISVAHVLGIAVPKVAILSAIDDVESSIPSTVDAAALSVMAERGQITGARLDGPLGMDDAVSLASATTKGIVSSVAGDADILIVPNLEAGNILYKSLTHFAKADAAGVIVGGVVPIILASRADSVRTRMAGAALASIVARAAR
jgi:phosphate acetyltransferase